MSVLAHTRKISHRNAMIATDSIITLAVPTSAALDDAILEVLQRADATSLSPPEIAQRISPQGDWHALLPPIRRAAVALAVQGRLIIYRKGKPADPMDFSGVYRIGLPRQD